MNNHFWVYCDGRALGRYDVTPVGDPDPDDNGLIQAGVFKNEYAEQIDCVRKKPAGGDWSAWEMI